MTKGDIIQIIQSIVTLLVGKKYNELVENDYEKKISAETLRAIIEDYGGLITAPPADAFGDIDIYTIKEGIHVSVDFDLWIDNVKSDLTLICDITNKDGGYRYSIDDIHVL